MWMCVRICLRCDTATDNTQAVGTINVNVRRTGLSLCLLYVCVSRTLHECVLGHTHTLMGRGDRARLEGSSHQSAKRTKNQLTPVGGGRGYGGALAQERGARRTLPHTWHCLRRYPSDRSLHSMCMLVCVFEPRPSEPRSLMV